MKYKKTLFLSLLTVASLAAYTFLYHAQLMTTPTEIVEGFSDQIQYVAEPAASPDVRALKGILKAIMNLLPAS